MTNIITSSMGVLGPRFAALDGVDDQAKLKELFLKSLRISAFLGFGICTATIIFGPKFIISWVGVDYKDAIPVLIILCCSYAFALSQNPGIPLLYALNKHRYYAYFTVAEALINITLSIMLAFHFGIIGVALGTMISMLIIKVIVMPIYICKVVNLSPMEYINILRHSFLCGLIIILIVYLSKLNIKINNANIYNYVLLCFGFTILFILLSMPIIRKEVFNKKRVNINES